MVKVTCRKSSHSAQVKFIKREVLCLTVYDDDDDDDGDGEYCA